MLRLRAGESCLALASSSTAAFLSAPTVAVWCLAFLNAKPVWPNKESDVHAIYSRGVSRGQRIGGKARARDGHMLARKP